MVNKLLLGLRDEAINKYSTNWTTNKIGGFPDWHHRIPTPTCTNCGKELSLIIQVYCPLESSIYHRTIYVFACCETLCRKCTARWRVIRQQTIDAIAPYDKQTIDLDTDWCEDADDWADSGDDIFLDDSSHIKKTCVDDPHYMQSLDGPSSSMHFIENSTLKCAYSNDIPENAYDSNDISQKLDEMEIDDALEDDESDLKCDVHPEELPVHVQSDVLKHLICSSDDSSFENDVSSVSASVTFCPYFISVIDDIRYDSSLNHENSLLKQYECTEDDIEKKLCKNERSKKSKSESYGEKYEPSIAKHGDHYFQKFMKTIANYPQQILRYCWNGEPLNISAEKFTNLHKCVCGSDRVFELQLISSLIYMLSPQSSNFSLDFGTVQIFACAASCWEDASYYKEEIVFVQSDTDQNFFDNCH